MSTKKIIGIVAACVAVLFTGITGVTSAILLNSSMQSLSDSFTDWSFGDTFDEVTVPSGVALVYVVGTIQNTSPTLEQTLSNTGYNHNGTLNYIEELANSSENEGIALYVDSPGGATYESDELYLALMDYKETTGRPVYAYFANLAASGGYYVACAADHIVANRGGWVGSIGVIISRTDMSGLYEKLGITQDIYTSGPFKTVAAEEYQEQEDVIFQGLVDDAFDLFVSVVAEGRGLSEATVRTIADGRLYTASQSLSNGLIDEIGNFEDLENYIMEDIGAEVNYEPLSAINTFDWLFMSAQQLLPKSEAQVLTELIENEKAVELLYEFQG